MQKEKGFGKNSKVIWLNAILSRVASLKDVLLFFIYHSAGIYWNKCYLFVHVGALQPGGGGQARAWFSQLQQTN